MRILHISDFHGYEPWFEWAHSVMFRFDLCVYSGDWLAFGRDDIRQQIARVSHWVRNCPVPLVTCTGNHDGVSPHRGCGGNGGWLHRLGVPGQVWVDDNVFNLGDWHGVVCGWQQEPSLPLPEDRPLMLVSHAPPSQTRLSASEGRDYGEDWVHELSHHAHPGSLFLCGHVHQPRGHVQQVGNFICVNAGRGSEAQDTPNHAIIDTHTHSVEVCAGKGVERMVW